MYTAVLNAGMDIQNRFPELYVCLPVDPAYQFPLYLHYNEVFSVRVTIVTQSTAQI